MRRLALVLLMILLSGCAGNSLGVKTDARSGATVIDSETLGVGFFKVTAKIIFSWHSDLPEKIVVTIYLPGTKNISDVLFKQGEKEARWHAGSATVYRNSGSYSRNAFMLAWPEFLAWAKAAETGEVSVSVTGPGNTLENLKLDQTDYKTRLLPFIDKVNKLKKYRSLNA